MTKVFVVDDEREMVDLVQLGLKKRGFAVVPFGSGADAIAALPEHDVDVVVTDLNMKGMTGFSVEFKGDDLVFYQPNGTFVASRKK